MAKQNVLLTLILLFTLNLFSQSNQEFDSEAITKILYQYTDDESPGMAVGIIKDGNIIYENYIGYANLEHKIKIDASTRFNIASTAKQFTALMILELSLKGKLNLEDDIREYVPSLYPKVKEDIKIRHLIDHSSGIRDYVFILEMMDNAYWRQVGMDNDDVIELLEKQEELVFKPGSKYSYSNSGYTILTKIIEKVSGEKFNDYSTAFFEKLGMNETAFIRGYMRVIPNRADPYSDWGSGVWLRDLMATKFNGDGFLYTTLKDQLIYEQAVQSANQKNDVLLIKSQQAIPNGEIEDYGFGLELDNRLGRVAQHHAGSTFGYHSQTIRFPNEKLSVFVMSNNGKIWSGYIADAIASAILPKINKKEIYDSRFYETSSETEQVPIIGQYVSSDGDLIRVEKEEGKMLWKFANYNPYEIIEESKNTFSPDYNSNIKIRFYENELVRYSPLGTTLTYKRQLYVPASFTDIEGFVGTYNSTELEMSFKIRLTENNELRLKFSNRDREREVTVLNRNELVASNFKMKVQRDQFDRATEILVTLNGRARNNRFRKKTNLKFQPKIETENGSIQVTTINSRDGETSDILLTKNYPNGNEIWTKRLGGESYDKASSILETKDGYLIIGSTSSYGNGNYDVYVIKTDKKGNKQWQNTYGNFDNEYGYIAEEAEDGFLIKGTIQTCTSSDVLNRECTTNVWFVYIDKDGREISSKKLEEL
ncbi:MAG: serine hydrolase domain-containing protein [Bacteroidota bacterium]